MFSREKVVDIELSHLLVTIEDLADYEAVRGLVRLHGTPIGYVRVPVVAGCCTATALSQIILEKYKWQIICQLLRNGLAAPPKPKGLRLEELFDLLPHTYDGELPLVTVAVCTRDRTSNLALCLDALSQLDYPNLDILVVDNAPSDQSTEHLVQSAYPNCRYVCEPRPGLDWARNRAIIAAQGEIIAYTDDDVVIDPGWVKALATVFAENPEVMAVTGLVVPYELETEAQILFEMYGGFGRGFERKWYRVGRGSKMPWQLLGSGQFGTGANMAYRRCLFDQIGYFDPALDVGTVTNGGGDLEMFFRVLKEGHTLVYEPSAIVRHRHRREYAKLRSQIANNGSLYSYFGCSALAYPEQRLSFLWIGLWWMWYWNIRRLLRSFIYPSRFPRDLILAELWGDLIGLTRYQQAHKHALQITATFGPQTPEVANKKSTPPRAEPVSHKATAVRTVELTQLIKPLSDITEYSDVRVFVTFNGSPIGSVDVANKYQIISSTRLSQAIVDGLGVKLLEPNSNFSIDLRWSKAIAAIQQQYKPLEDQAIVTTANLPNNISVSVVVATYDRPHDLRTCLRHLTTQKSSRPIEIVVVDNNPASGMTPPVVAKFPGVVLVSEPRKGLAYARNAGFVASKGNILLATDDDVTMPPDWIEKLIAPFARADVMIVTGNVLPLELATSSQRFFEGYGGLGRGFERREVNGDWFEAFRRLAVPTWQLGATANAAFRATIFSHPEIGLMDEALGPGMPSGVGEDTYLFYKVLKAGYTAIYEPSAYVWHKHRRDLSALRRQLYNYSKGHVAYHLTTLLRDRDLRSLPYLLIHIPRWRCRQILQHLRSRIRGQRTYSLSLILLEVIGNLAGPWSLWRSHQRVRREGRSGQYVPVSERSVAVVLPLQPIETETQNSSLPLPEIVADTASVSSRANLDLSK